MNILPISGSVLDIQEDRDVDDNATNAVEEVYIFTEEEVVVFRGTDDLKFNLMLVTIFISFIINSYYTIIKYKIVVKKDKRMQCF